MRSEINRAIDLADELIDQIGNETDNVADFLAGIAPPAGRIAGLQRLPPVVAQPIPTEDANGVRG